MAIPEAGFCLSVVLGLQWNPRQGVSEELSLYVLEAPCPLFACKRLLLPFFPREGARHQWLKRTDLGQRTVSEGSGLSTSPDLILLEYIHVRGILSL